MLHRSSQLTRLRTFLVILKWILHLLDQPPSEELQNGRNSTYRSQPNRLPCRNPTKKSKSQQSRSQPKGSISNGRPAAEADAVEHTKSAKKKAFSIYDSFIKDTSPQETITKSSNSTKSESLSCYPSTSASRSESITCHSIGEVQSGTSVVASQQI